MSLETHPDWWNFELELSPHVEERMIDRGFSEVDLRLMIETTAAIRRGGAKGRWTLEQPTMAMLGKSSWSRMNAIR